MMGVARGLPKPIVAAAAFMLVAVSQVVGLPPAAAAEPAVAQPAAFVSSDGVHFSASASGIFDGAGLLVPGDAVTASIWVKNAAPTTAALRVSLRELLTSSTDYAENVSLTISESMTGSISRSSLADLGDCAALVRVPRVPADGVLRIDLRLSMGDDIGGSTAQGGQSSFGLAVAMRDSAAGAFPDSACDDGGPVVSTLSDRYDSIASTGAEASSSLQLIGGLSVVIGAFLIGVRRRRGETDDAATRE